MIGAQQVEADPGQLLAEERFRAAVLCLHERVVGPEPGGQVLGAGGLRG